MSGNISQQLNVMDLENLRSELTDKTINVPTGALKLFVYMKYFNSILKIGNPLLFEAFLHEFVGDYLQCAAKYEICGIDPSLTQSVISQLLLIKNMKLDEEYYELLTLITTRIESQSILLGEVLQGSVSQKGALKPFFPLIVPDAPTGLYGILDSISIRINKSPDRDRFILIPSEIEIERLIKAQCLKSWQAALSLSWEYVKKPFRYHEVIINFDRKEGFYQGNSLGISLTIAFLEQILLFYNSSYRLDIQGKIAFTGGVEENGELLCTGKDIIAQKTAAVFFSDIGLFVIPKPEEKSAFNALHELKRKYPKRDLNIIGIQQVQDIINLIPVIEEKNSLARLSKNNYEYSGPVFTTDKEYRTIRLTKNSSHTLKFLPGKLVLTDGSDKGKEFRIAGFPTPEGIVVSIGRKQVLGERAYAHIELKEITVSRDQAELIHKNGKLYVKNLSETNYTQINGTELKIGECTEVSPGSRIKTGEVEFLYQLGVN